MGTFVQAQKNGTLSTVNNITVTMDSTVTAANELQIDHIYIHGSVLTVTSVKDQALNVLSFTEPQIERRDAGNTVNVRQLVVKNTGSGITAITITMSGSSDFGMGAIVTEYSGLSTTAPVDATGMNAQVQTGTLTTTDATTSGSFTPTAQPGLIHGFSINCSNATTPAAGTGFTSAVNQVLTLTGACSGRAEYKTFSATTATAATFTNTSTGGQTLINFGLVLLDSGGGAVVASQGQDHRAQTFTFMGRR